MENQIIISLPNLINSQIRQKDKDETLALCKSLLIFSYQNELLKKNIYDKGIFIDDIEIFENDLTDKGKLTFEKLVDKWLAYTDRTQKYDNVSMLEKWLNQLNNQK
ncbi:hypothetical protein [Pedobacter alluvionis]|uniref:Uncharacterized protein n=1 Tax=Pedobacter alluvionis TaxID=475253 RepID=A0A497XMK5_9SPHI|nr:hypothetical protein [Pedobacter alluvionis]RLJ69179.1 hypothetical protein BCL90_5273 [Pedobacter alluvionis]TFB29728.1 hypothetical protein E3V97_16155 [Pedobacter alluvionis]